MRHSLSTNDYISIGQASKLLNMSIDTIRYYEKIDLIPHLQRRESGYRKLGFNDLLHLKGIAYLRQCGLSIDEIKNVYNDPVSKKQAIDRALDELDKQIQALEASKQFLKEAKVDLEAFESGKRGYVLERLNGYFTPTHVQNLSLKDYLNLDDLA